MTQEGPDRVECDGGGGWQGAGQHEASARVVLHCVLAQCAAPDLWRCGAVCRAWRRAAADAQLWRRLLQPRARPATLAALAGLNEIAGCYDDEASVSTGGWWRGQYALSAARWRRRGQLAAAADGAAIAAAALHRAASLLALLRDDGRITVWSSTSTEYEPADPASWQKRWEGGAGAEWSCGADARWAPRAPRLLVAGTLALADRLEVIVYDFEVPGRGAVLCRATAVGAGGAAGCWVDDAVFLTLELRLLAPGHACTTVWLNAATQKTQSEHAGVMSPLLRIYNESAATISDVAVVELPPESKVGAEPGAKAGAEAEAEAGAKAGADVELGCREPDTTYYHALASKHRSTPTGMHGLIAVGGATGGERGCGRALLLWRLPRSLAPAQLLVRDGLAERVRRRRERPHTPPPEVEPDEAAVRALCTPPQAFCLLPSQILGFIVHPKPMGGGSGCAWTWVVRAGAAGAALSAAAPVLATLLLPRPHSHRVPPTLALLTTDALELWQIRLP
ncbi:uncharacterized protein LOC121726433 isoform X2 [Aricia agestis]|uniref:uncharacterized protein LOC121726433 isoform X2 n=1 Tax=Aricia agestis TaxID=91739 RepID=UPI001C204C56|nr:uncharacterized protein LOC121726433 isoform X2 [Aricia agestis]